ncbi:MAG: hypothetical protein GX294_00070 [Candidatus Cloacimonetes bacterium]|nr:hypothetical protein [Candidatus Cloacimonadota bacterium]
MPKAEFDRQQKYLWSLVRQAGWDKAVKGKKYCRFSAYLLKTFKVTHANALSPVEMRQAIATLKPYAAKEAHNRKKKLNACIMAHVARHGFTLDWLHENMVHWGYGDSVRALSYKQTTELYALVRKTLI